MNSNLRSYIEYLTREKLEQNMKQESMLDIGYPMNLKNTETHAAAKIEILKSFPFLLHYRNPMIMEPFWTAQLMKEEKSLITELIAPWGGTPENTWGYITSGGSESNLAAIKFALKLFRPRKPILVFSKETHYSIIKFLDFCESSFLDCVIAPTNLSGQMDHTQIWDILEACYSPGTPVIVIATLGTTMKGATDDVLKIREVLLEKGVRKDNLYVHADAALNGGFWHLDKANYPYQLGNDTNLLSISGYKCWKIRLLQFDWQQEYNMCQERVKHIESMLRKLDIESLINPASIIICFPKPPQEIIQKYVLPTHYDEHLGNISHLVVLPHVTKDIVDSFILDLNQHLGDKGLRFVYRQSLV
ncbi:Histidine decarboxylase [Oopsacas minuta]|uniref:Histidine decarboxylase n=1 Tax=Oopsacas minuta TaxID=111878 RepID=A0AAV7KC00_9METZ|nr:Histidine decarboxylase [Oopsacas minuta]